MTGPTRPIRVLVVEDEPVAAEAHRAYLGRVPGFEVAGVVHSGADTLRFLSRHEVDLVLLDFHLPDGHGLALCRAMRAAGHRADVIAVTSARDLDVVRSAVAQGVVQYLLKPFTFPAFRDKLERYARYRAELAEQEAATSQRDVDRLLASLRGVTDAAPRGITGETLDAVLVLLADADAAGRGLSAGEVAAALNVSRVTARRYLEHVAETGQARREPRYGGTGRPEMEYRLRR